MISIHNSLELKIKVIEAGVAVYEHIATPEDELMGKIRTIVKQLNGERK
jgi:hypothetical protein